MTASCSFRVAQTLTIACILFLAHAAGATTIVAKDLSELCHEADLIFVGTVTDTQSQWAGEEKQSIETLVTFGDLEVLAGVEGDSVTLRFAGGEVGEIREEVAGMPRPVKGERYVILARRGNAISPIVGFSQGCFHVVESAGASRIHDAAGKPLKMQNGDLRADDPAAPGMELSELLEAIREHIKSREEAR